jgi:hypothetical protein
MRRLIFCLTLILLKSLYCSAQFFDYDATVETKNLKSKGADSILYFSGSVSGGTSVPYEVDSFKCNPPQYSVWKRHGKTFAQKIMWCYTPSLNDIKIYSEVVTIDADSVYHFLAAQIGSIYERNVEPLIYKQNRGGREYYDVGWTFHPYIYKLVIAIGDTIVHKSVNEHDLREYHGYPEQVNLNYHYNQSAAIWKFVALIDRLIRELEEKKMFRFK